MGRLRRDATLSGPNYRFRRACDRVVTLCCQGSRLAHYVPFGEHNGLRGRAAALQVSAFLYVVLIYLLLYR